jgi:hypothetical protein
MPAAFLAAALLKWNHLRLSARCHAGFWNASLAEVQQIREYVGIEWLMKHHPKVSRLSMSGYLSGPRIIIGNSLRDGDDSIATCGLEPLKIHLEKLS